VMCFEKIMHYSWP